MVLTGQVPHKKAFFFKCFPFGNLLERDTHLDKSVTDEWFLNTIAVTNL